MKKIIIWGEEMPVSGRIFKRGSINLPKSKSVDIMLMCNSEKWEKIGKADLIENSKGIFATNIEHYINIDLLKDLQSSSYKEYTITNGEVKYSPELTIANKGKGTLRGLYTSDAPVDFAFLYYHVTTNDDVRAIVRGLKLSSIID